MRRGKGSMTVRDFFDSLIKHSRLIAFLTSVSIVVCAVFLNFTQSSTASVIIKYINKDAVYGLTENGDNIRPYEVNSSTVIRKAVEQLGYEDVDTERLRRNVTVTPIVPTAEEEKYASWIENFADYSNTEEEKEFPVYYEVSYTSAMGRDFAKNALNSIIKQYRIFYAKNYTYSSDITDLGGEIVQQYDYYETVDMLDNKIRNNMEYLGNISENDLNYRSIKTGYSIDDLIQEYNNLLNQDLAVAERMVLEKGVSRDTGVLINSLQSKIIDAEASSGLNEEKASSNKELMSIYSEKNKQYLWEDDNDSDQGSTEEGQVDADIERDEIYMRNKSTYDQLMLDYVGYRTDSENSLIDKSMYENAISSFSVSKADSGTMSTVEALLNEICEDYNELYSLTEIVIDDYNSFKSSRSIETESDVTVSNNRNSVFSYGISIIVSLGIGVVFTTMYELIYRRKTEKQKNKTDNE